MKENSQHKAQDSSRRKFITGTTLGAAGLLSVSNILSSCSREVQKQEALPVMLDRATEGRPLRAGLIGCGGRGTGAAINFVDAGPNLEIVALGDVFQDKITQCREELRKERNIEIDDDKCFVGFDNFEKVIDAGVDVVLLCTPPHFRPQHLEAAINARKHVFMEKPCAVDPVGARSVMVSAKKAEQMDLCIVSGTIRRVQKDFMETRRQVVNGLIGEITGANIIRNGGSLWYRSRNPQWSDMEYMLRNWANFNWLSGDHIVEQFIHEIDVMNWYIGKNPIKALGWGGRQRRITGDQYDFFSIEYVYDNGMHTHCAARQISGCSNQTLQLITGTKGRADARGTITDLQGNPIWEYPKPTDGDTDSKWKVTNPFDQEHINLVNAIRSGVTINDAEDHINSTLIAIMGRMAAYTGKDVTWDEVLNSDLYLGPKVYAFGAVPGIPEVPPVIGIDPSPASS